MPDRRAKPKKNEYETALQDAVGDEPGSDELRRMYDVLIKRRDLLWQEREAEPQLREKLDKALEKLDEQIAVLREEADITGFIEDAVRVGMEMRKQQDGF